MSLFHSASPQLTPMWRIFREQFFFRILVRIRFCIASLAGWNINRKNGWHREKKIYIFFRFLPRHHGIGMEHFALNLCKCCDDCTISHKLTIYFDWINESDLYLPEPFLIFCSKKCTHQKQKINKQKKKIIEEDQINERRITAETEFRRKLCDFCVLLQVCSLTNDRNVHHVHHSHRKDRINA